MSRSMVHSNCLFDYIPCTDLGEIFFAKRGVKWENTAKKKKKKEEERGQKKKTGFPKTRIVAENSHMINHRAERGNE